MAWEMLAFLLPDLLQGLGLSMDSKISEETMRKLTNYLRKVEAQLASEANKFGSTGMSSSLGSNMPNKDNLRNAMYQDLTQDTYNIQKEIEDARAKDKRENGSIWHKIGSLASGLADIGFDMSSFGFWSKDPQNVRSKWNGRTFKEQYDREVLSPNETKAMEKMDKVQSQFKEKLANFNQKVIQSHNKYSNNARVVANITAARGGK